MAAYFDAIVIGASISGFYQLYKLCELGLNVRVFETGTSFAALGTGTVIPARVSPRKAIPTGIAVSAAEQLIASIADCFKNSGEAD